MKMIKTLTIAALLSFATLASAQGVQGVPPSTTFEISIFSVNLPVSANGRVSIRECDDCDYHSIRVTPQTVYQLNGQTVRLKDFRKAITDLRRDGDITVNVKRDDTSNTVASIRVTQQ